MAHKGKLFVISSIFMIIGCSSGNSLSAPFSSEKPSSNSSINVTTSLESSNTSSSSENTTNSENSSSSYEISSLSSELSSSSNKEVFYEVIVINGTGSNNHVLEGDLVTITADKEEEGSKFVGWKDEEGNIVSTNKTYTFSCNKSVTLTAVYETIKCNLIVTGGTGGGTYDYGSQVTLTASIKETEEFVAWVDENENIVSKENPYVFNIKNDMNLTAKTQFKVGEGQLTLEKLETYIQGDWLGGSTSSELAFNANFNQDKSFTLIDNKRQVNKISCSGTWEITTSLDKEATHVSNDASATSDYLLVKINNLTLVNKDGYTKFLAIHFAVARDGSAFALHYQAPYNDSTSQLIDLVKKI